MWPWRVKMPNQNLSRLLLLLMLMMRIMFATVCCRFGSWGLAKKLLFRLWAFWSIFWSWNSSEILELKFGQYFAADVWLTLRNWILVKIPKLGLFKILTLGLVGMLMFGWKFWSQCLITVWISLEHFSLGFHNSYLRTIHLRWALSSNVSINACVNGHW